MAGTLRPDAEFSRFNRAKENMGNYFRFKPRSIAFNVVFMGLVPAGITYAAYAYDGQLSFNRRFRSDAVLQKEYVPRQKDL